MKAQRSRESDLPARRGGRIATLDGIRGIAILFVMVYHFTFYGGMRPAMLVDRIYYQGALVGWFGVDLFFVLSGFLITGILCDSVGDRHYFRSFYMRRILRIFPLYYGALAVFFFLVPRVWQFSEACQALQKDQLWYWSYLLNFQIARQSWPECFVLGHFWSLAVEEQFYLAWPLLVWLLSRRRLQALCLAALGGALVMRVILLATGQVTGAYVLMPARADALAIGCLLALTARGPGGLQRLAGWVKPAALGSALLLGSMFVWRRGLSTEDPVIVSVGFTFLAVLFGSVILVAVRASPASKPGRMLRHPALAFFGRYSYGLYVVHHPIAISLGKSALGVDAGPRLFGSQIPYQLLFTVIATVLSLAVAMLSWHLYEEPIMRLKRKFPYGG